LVSAKAKPAAGRHAAVEVEVHATFEDPVIM